MMIQN